MGSVATFLIDIATNTSALKTGLDRARGEIKDFRSMAENAMNGLAKTVTTAALGFASFETAKAIFVDMVHDVAEAEKATLKLEAVLKATGYSAGLSAKQIDQMSSQMARSSLFDDEDIRNAAAQLASFRNISGQTFRDTMTAAVDLSTVMDQDLRSSVVQLGKALNDPIQGMSALQRVGVSFTATQKQQIEQLVKANNLVGAQRIVLQELQKEFGGAGEQAASGLSGAIVQAKNAWHDFLEELGKTGDTVGEQQGYFARFFSGLSEIIRSMTPNNDPMQKLGKEILDIKREIQTTEETIRLMRDKGLPTLQVEGHLSILQAELAKLQRDAKAAVQEVQAPKPKPAPLGPTEDEGKAIESIIKKLKEEAATVGFTDAQKNRYILTVNHATKAQLAEYDALVKLVAMREREQKILGGNLGPMRDLTRQGASVQEQAAMVDAANKGGLSLAMIGVGGDRGKSPFTALKEQTKSTAQLWKETWRDALQASTQAFANFFQQAFTEGAKLRDFLKGLLASIANVFATMAANGLSKIVTKAVGLNVAPTSGGGGDAGGGITGRYAALGADGGRVAPVIVHQNITFAPGFVDGASGEQWLQAKSGTIAGIVARAATDAPAFARHIVASGMRA